MVLWARGQHFPFPLFLLSSKIAIIKHSFFFQLHSFIRKRFKTRDYHKCCIDKSQIIEFSENELLLIGIFDVMSFVKVQKIWQWIITSRKRIWGHESMRSCAISFVNLSVSSLRWIYQDYSTSVLRIKNHQNFKWRHFFASPLSTENVNHRTENKISSFFLFLNVFPEAEKNTHQIKLPNDNGRSRRSDL